jgi:hypothetical protein
MDKQSAAPRRVVPHSPVAVPAATAYTQDSATAKMNELLCEYRKIASPDVATLARVEAEVNRLYRAGLGSPAMLAVMMEQIQIHIALLPRPYPAADVPALAVAAATTFFGDGSRQGAIANILSYVLPYQKGLAHFADAPAQIEGLRAAARAARLVANPLRRLDAARVFEEISPHLRGLPELALSDAPAEPPLPGAAVAVADAFLLGAIGGRQLDRREVLRDVLVGIEAVVRAHAPPRHRGLAPLGRDVDIVARQLRYLRKAMAGLDERLLRRLVPARMGDPAQAPMEALARLLEGFAGAAGAAAQAMKAPMGRPKAPDPLLLGVEQLAILWREARGTPPRTTNIKGGFCDLCLSLLGAKGLGFKESAIRGQVRHVVLAPALPAPG